MYYEPIVNNVAWSSRSHCFKSDRTALESDWHAVADAGQLEWSHLKCTAFQEGADWPPLRSTHRDSLRIPSHLYFRTSGRFPQGPSNLRLKLNTFLQPQVSRIPVILFRASFTPLWRLLISSASSVNCNFSSGQSKPERECILFKMVPVSSTRNCIDYLGASLTDDRACSCELLFGNWYRRGFRLEMSISGCAPAHTILFSTGIVAQENRTFEGYTYAISLLPD
jgi:hypothetical protein